MEYGLKRLGRELVYPGKVLNFYKDTMELPDGRIEEWDFLEHKRGGACVVPVLEDGRILMIRQYRPAVDRETLELPAGARDRDAATGEMEDPALTAARELREETGYTSDSVVHLLSLRTAVAYCSEFTEVYLAEHLKPAGDQILAVVRDKGYALYAFPPLQELMDRLRKYSKPLSRQERERYNLDQ